MFPHGVLEKDSSNTAMRRIPHNSESVTENARKSVSVTFGHVSVTPQTIDNKPVTQNVTDVTHFRQYFCMNEKINFV